MTSNAHCKSSDNFSGDNSILSFPRRLAARLRQRQKFVLLAHDRPDGDALGSMLALARAARLMGKQVRIICDSLPEKYAFAADGEEFYRNENFLDCALWANHIVILDTCTLSQLDSICDGIVSQWNKLLVIDHHKVASDIAPIRWVDSSASATAVLVFELIKDLGWKTDRSVAEAVLLGIMSDTGWLKFSNTDSRTMNIAGECLDLGADQDKLYRNLYQSDRPERLALITRALNNLELLDMGESRLLAFTSLGEGDFAISGAEVAECEDIINEPLRVSRVAVSVLVSQRGDQLRCSLRSRPDSGVDVASIARSFGGGGHERAAGLTFAEADAQVARSKIVAAILDAGK